MRKIYVAEYSFGTPSIMEVTVERETPKTFTVASKRSVLKSHYVGKLVRKDDPWFATPQAALTWCIEQHQKYIARRQEDLAKSKALLVELQELASLASNGIDIQTE